MNKLSHWVLVGCLAFITMLYNSCKLLRPTKELKEVSKDVSKEKREINVDIIDTNFSFEKIFNDKTKTDFNEEILIKKQPQTDPIELTATFKIDTTSYLNKDTLLKLVDINDSKVSVTIYQNKKTNELTAKVSSKNGVKNVAFDELQIKRSLNQIKDVESKETDNQLTNTDKSTTKEVTNKEVVNKSIKISDWTQTIVISILLIGAVIWIAFQNKNNNNKK